MAVGVILFTGLKATFDTDHFHPQLNQASADTHAGNKGDGNKPNGQQLPCHWRLK
jgi:hypothetical protein